MTSPLDGIDAQSIVVASTATNWFGHEGTILRFVFWHSIALACLVGCLVMAQAYIFTGLIVPRHKHQRLNISARRATSAGRFISKFRSPPLRHIP